MPRPIKYRQVCKLPQNFSFAPMDAKGDLSMVSLTVDEYETIRLIDLEKFTQEECAEQMNVARTTVQGIYAEARSKIARFLVEGLMLSIEGGEYRLCDGQDEGCGRGCCYHRPGQGLGQGQRLGQGQGQGQGQGRGRAGRGAGRGINRLRQIDLKKLEEKKNENSITGK